MQVLAGALNELVDGLRLLLSLFLVGRRRGHPAAPTPS